MKMNLKIWLSAFITCGALATALASSAIAQDEPNCFLIRKAAYGAQKDSDNASREFDKLMTRYDSSTSKQFAAVRKVIDDIGTIDGQITGILGQLGVTGVSTIFNSLSCSSASFQTFCDNRRGWFLQLASRYATLTGKKRAQTLRLSSTNKTYGAQSKRAYNRAFTQWQTYLANFDRANYAQYIYLKCQNWNWNADGKHPYTLSDPGAPINCQDTTTTTDPTGSSSSGSSSFWDFLKKAATYLSNSSTAVQAPTITVAPGCPSPPEVPPMVTDGGNGCINLFGFESLSSALGAQICGNSLVDAVLGG